jgi:hypothetical protein
MKEINLVGAVLGGGFANTIELHIMTYYQAILQPDTENWEKAAEEEQNLI